MNDLLLGFLTCLGIGFILLGIESVGKKKKYPVEFTRNIAHIFVGIFGILMSLTLESNVFIGFALVITGLISISYLRNHLTTIHSVKRKTFGEILLPMGILAGFMITEGPTTGYIATILSLTLADPLAYLIRQQKLGALKNIASYVGFFAVTFASIGFIVGGEYQTVFIISLLLTATEAFSPYGLDNFTIPVVGTSLFQVLL